MNCAAENTQIWVFLTGLCSLELYLINPQGDDRDSQVDDRDSQGDDCDSQVDDRDSQVDDRDSQVDDCASQVYYCDADCDENLIKDYSRDYWRWASATLQDFKQIAIKKTEN